MKKENIKYKCIYNLRLAGYLMMNKQPIQRIEVNLDRPWRNVYLFKESEKIEKLINKYRETSKEEKEDGINNEKCKNNSTR